MSVGLYGPEFFVGRSETVCRSAAAVVPVIVELVAPTSVLDLGCGQGEWLEAFGLDDMVGVDIAAPAGHLRHDLTEPLDLGRRFDLAMSLETGEHLPEAAAATLVGSLAHHSDSIVFSAAVPGQEGKGHINCQPHDYWHRLFANAGFEPHDVIRPRIARDTQVSDWYRNNLYLYRRA